MSDQSRVFIGLLRPPKLMGLRRGDAPDRARDLREPDGRRSTCDRQRVCRGPAGAGEYFWCAG